MTASGDSCVVVTMTKVILVVVTILMMEVRFGYTTQLNFLVVGFMNLNLELKIYSNLNLRIWS